MSVGESLARFAASQKKTIEREKDSILDYEDKLTFTRNKSFV